MQTFQQIFAKYSPEQTTPDEIDWISYLRAKQLHRFLISLNGDYSADHVREAFSRFAETPAKSFPSCPLDFSATSHVGQHAWPVYLNEAGTWSQAAFCADASLSVDVAPPVISCDQIAVAPSALTCSAFDERSGVGAWTITSTGAPSSGNGGCAHGAMLRIRLRKARTRWTSARRIAQDTAQG